MNLIHELLAYFTAPVHQKTAQQISRIDQEKEKIYVEDWETTLGWFEVYLYRSTWPTKVECYKKEFMPWEPADYFRAAGYNIGEDFDAWWGKWSTEEQRPLVEKFISIHEGTLQKELDEYYTSYTNGNQ